ncbi:phosphoribosyl-dephospho-CoA transferase [Chryseobacterium rhizosphaerae]|uniref:malonate decarboxylase holo-ACP synthase n=1 Tax=Chryseobacterium rhizosphaerae TaxID=395937 RepID=UPI002866B9C0|nr:malonate decarboxylase holo-ACP synthase [Chryseobacterium rhizosphaerae]MDR6548167.1 phosphoribosyl-dephospho-CoA transferase [Chryseobacterium rhizosphaerae]
MELTPHDLIRIYNQDDLLTDASLPEWAVSALVHAPYAVVRRAPSKNGLIPVGIRGSKKNERLPAWLISSVVYEVISPEMLVSPLQWKIKQHELNPSILSLKSITPILNQEKLYWGPTGSTAFELATGIKTLTEESDLDLVLRYNNPLPIAEGLSLLDKLNKEAGVRLDIQLETPLGGVSLAEYVNSTTVLVKTLTGPMIVDRKTLWSKLDHVMTFKQ